MKKHFESVKYSKKEILMKSLKVTVWGRRGAAFLFFLFFMGTGVGSGAFLLKYFQIGPAVSSFRMGNGLLLGGMILLLILILTLLFGRFYCSFLCPLGLVQEFFLLPFKGRKGTLPKGGRLALGGILWGLFLAGASWSFWLLDPFTLFMRGFGGGKASFWIPLIIFGVLFLLVLWKGRIFCNSFCPVGALLGGISRFALFPLQIHSNCVGCGKCVKKCPAGSITGEGKEKKLDPSSCILCLDCVQTCPVNAISSGKKEFSKLPPDETRRTLLKEGGILAAGLAAGAFAGIAGKGKNGLNAFFPEEKNMLLPPGAISAKEFFRKCLSCQLCAASCPAGVIQIRKNGMGGVALSYEKSHCLYDCHICMQVCPAGALKRFSLAEKKRLQIAAVQYDPRKCIVLQESEDCGKCADGCPAGGIVLRKLPTGLSMPRVVPEKCIGCGKCFHACPSNGAITIKAIPEQKLLNSTSK